MEDQNINLTEAELEMLRCLQTAGKARGIEVTFENSQLVYRSSGEIIERKPYEYLQRMVEASDGQNAGKAQGA